MRACVCASYLLFSTLRPLRNDVSPMASEEVEGCLCLCPAFFSFSFSCNCFTPTTDFRITIRRSTICASVHISVLYDIMPTYCTVVPLCGMGEDNFHLGSALWLLSCEKRNPKVHGNKNKFDATTVRRTRDGLHPFSFTNVYDVLHTTMYCISEGRRACTSVLLTPPPLPTELKRDIHHMFCLFSRFN